MQQWKKWLSALAITALLLGGTGAAQAADTPANGNTQGQDDKSVDHHGEHHKHDGQHQGKHKLTPEQKDALKKAGIDPQVMKETQHEIRETLRSIKNQGHELHELVRNSKDSKLRSQVQEDLEAFRENMRQAHELHKANRDLHDQFITAVDKSDTAKIKDLFNKMQANQKQELKFVQAAEKAMAAELKKVQGQVKS